MLEKAIKFLFAVSVAAGTVATVLVEFNKVSDETSKKLSESFDKGISDNQTKTT